jgi:hypothetical protein
MNPVKGDKVKVSFKAIDGFKDIDSLKRMTKQDDIQIYLDNIRNFVNDNKDTLIRNEERFGIVTYIEDYEDNPYLEVEYEDGSKFGIFANQLKNG